MGCWYCFISKIMRQNILTTIILFTIIASLRLNAQSDMKLSIKPSLSLINSTESIYINSLNNERNSKSINLGLDLNYKLNVVNDIGIYTAFSKTLHPFMPQGAIDYDFNKANAIFYGLNYELHLIPLFSGVNNLKIDIYNIAKVGLVSQFWHPCNGGIDESSDTESKHTLEYGLGLGTSYSISKQLGIFIEYNFGKFLNDDYTKLRYGIKFTL